MKFGELLNINLPIVACFYADWNLQSSEVISMLRRLSILVEGRAKVLKLDVDKNRELARALEIGILPTTIIYKDRQQVIKYEGMVQMDDIMNRINLLS